VIVSDPNVILETLKPAADGEGFVARFYEASGGWRSTAVEFPLLRASDWDLETVDLMERPAPGNIGLLSGESLRFSLTMTAFELASVLFRKRK
jgi:alpha-mannosidase